MKNPFKFGTVVEDEYFTDRKEELQYVKQVMSSENHLILISPRRFGKTSLVLKAVKLLARPYIMLNLQNVTSSEDLAARLLQAVFKLYPWERMKHLMTHFRIIPTLSTNPLGDNIEVSFQPSVNSAILLEDAFQLLEKVSQEQKRLIVIFDEFQEVQAIGKGLDRQLRSIIQLQKEVNYIFLGSQESMMQEIFEKKKSPFYHFGILMRLKKIPYDDFFKYIADRMATGTKSRDEEVAQNILQFTRCHPYYTQQLAYQAWEEVNYTNNDGEIVQTAIGKLLRMHDFDYERLWINFNRTDKRILQELCKTGAVSPLKNKDLPTSTIFSALKRLMKIGYVTKEEDYEVEDPFFQLWIRNQG
ncbi:MAG: ATP-binding protein [Bacteroides sp.]|nr:ATP-binding protein [Bacteroides sp.]